MPFKINIGTKKGLTFRFEIESDVLIGKKIGDIIKGEDLKPELKGYELKITGLSDKAGFPSLPNLEGVGLRRVLLSYGSGMREKKPRGLRKKKTVRGNTIDYDIVQINTVVEKEGTKKLEEIFPDQVKIKKQQQAPSEQTTSEATEKEENK